MCMYICIRATSSVTDTVTMTRIDLMIVQGESQRKPDSERQ